MEKYVFIINPKAGHFNAEHIKEKIQARCTSRNISFETHTTESPGQASLITEKIADSKEGTSICIVSVGGDGTLHEIVNALSKAEQAHNISLGIIPVGSGNDFIKTLGYPAKLNDVIDFILSNNYQLKMSFPGIIDYTDSYGNTHSRSFINAVGIGFDAYVAYLKNRNKTIPAAVSYLTSVIKALRGLAYLDCSITVDSLQINEKLILLTIGNGTCSGGGFYLTPHADPFKPELDLAIVEKASKSYIVRKLPKALLNTIDDIPEIRFFKFKELKIDLEQPYYAHADGEILTERIKSIRVRIDTKPIKFIAGK